jgi:SH3-like domain-containing protein
MKEQIPNENWQLQEGAPPDQRWILQESEQPVSDQWSLQSAPLDEGREWQPVEYVKPARSPIAWLLPTVITIALLAVLGYTAYALLPWSRGEEDPVAVVPPETQEGTVEPATTSVTTTAATGQEETAEPIVTPAATPTEAEPAAPTLVPLVAQRFGVITSAYGLNARVAPNTDAALIRILEQGETLFVFDVQGEWVELFVSDTPLAEGQPMSGTVGFAASEFMEISDREVSRDLVNQVLSFVGRPLLDEAVQPAVEAPITETTDVTGTAGAGVGESDIPLPTVTPTPEGATELSETVAPTGTALSEADVVTVTINALNGVNVRRDPTAEVENVIRLLENGTILTAVARSEDGAWVQVLLPDGLTGWVTAEFLQASDGLENLPLPGEAQPETTADAPVAAGEVITSGFEVAAPFTNVVPSGNAPAIIVTVADGVNARSSPDVEAEAVLIAPQGAVLPALARSPDSQWVQVLLPTGEEAWIFRDTVTATPAVGALPPLEVETPTPTPEPTPTEEATPTPEPTEATEPDATASVRQLLLVVYAEPSNDAADIARSPRGSTLQVTGRNTAGDWLQVLTEDGQTGWVSANGVSVSVPIDSLPVAE